MKRYAAMIRFLFWAMLMCAAMVQSQASATPDNQGKKEHVRPAGTRQRLHRQRAIPTTTHHHDGECRHRSRSCQPNQRNRPGFSRRRFGNSNSGVCGVHGNSNGAACGGGISSGVLLARAAPHPARGIGERGVAPQPSGIGVGDSSMMKRRQL